ncbi:uncharacterized protein N7469_010840 [Penicillium citrinum]|uniref:Cutinase n=1 Tax=Penicillium citrinum TaxID=5077 RepID=A0A9W9NLH8_PENCI|nr:uncharacterized protein N7469_010840 [Penicillium citrinum]KAJ5221953.1 hypothetical protein N7469_010840 [Penicillium citrinum]
MKSAAFLYVLSTAFAAPTRTIEERQLPGLGGSGSGSDSGIGAISSLFPGLGGSGDGSSDDSSSGSSGLPGLGGSSTGSGLGSIESLFPGLGGSGGSSSSSGGLPSISDLPGLGGSSSGSGLDALSSLIPSSGSSGSSGAGLPGLSGFKKRQIPGLGGSSTGSGLGSIDLPGLGGSSTGSGIGALSSLLPSGGSSGSSTGSGLEALSSLFPSAGSGGSSDSGFPDLSSLFSRQLGGLGGSITENGVTQNDGCQPLTFIFARGSTEMGNMGSVVGPPVASALKSQLNNKVTVQGVTYDAGIASNAEMGANGGPVMAKLVKQALKQCPKTKVVLGGYSQGSMVVHNAANSLSADQISAAVLFGDPFKAMSVGKLASSKVKEFCAAGDPVCENGVNVMAHITYGGDAKEAASFLIKASGVSSS